MLFRPADFPMDNPTDSHLAFEHEVESRFGVLPHFFQSAPDAPELVQQLWIYAKAAYLDNPLPALFKERLFVYLSRFCEIRYCIVRHVGFLVGRGRPSGDLRAVPHSVEQVVRLLRRPVSDSDELQTVISTLAALPAALSSWTLPETTDEDMVFRVATALFLEPGRAELAKYALRKAVGPVHFELLVGFLSFVRTAHYWTLLHPELAYEEDVKALMREHDQLAELMLHDPEAGRCDMGHRLFDELAGLREVVSLRDAVRESELAKRRLEDLHRHKDAFLAVVSHELRNPISAISNVSELLGRLQLQDARLDEMQGILSRQTAALARIVDDLLDVSRASLDKLSIQREPLDLRDLVRDSVSDHESSFAAAGLELHIEIPDKSVPVSADRVRASQVFQNLLSNARRFTPAPGEVFVRVRVEAAEAIVEVSDSGVGFSAELAETLFLPFVQAGQEARQHGGLGLGLAIGRRIAELHGGTLSATSPGLHRGARFTWTIAIDTDQPADREDAKHSPVAESPHLRILLIEDDGDVGHALHRLLQVAGYETRLAHDGASALTHLASWCPDVVLCDLGLSDHPPGFEFARACGRDSRFARIRLVAVSGCCTSESIEQAREAGFEQYICKPVDLDKIRSALAGLLSKPPLSPRSVR